MTEDKNGEKNSLNKIKSEPLEINKGFELMLRHRNRRRKKLRPKTFRIMFGKVISLFKREIRINFELSIDIKKQ
jgi:hypothetical protein